MSALDSFMHVNVFDISSIDAKFTNVGYFDYINIEP